MAALLLLVLAGTCIAVGSAAPKDHPLSYSDLTISDRHGEVLGKFATQGRQRQWRSCKSASDGEHVLECREWDDGRQLRIEQYGDCLKSLADETGDVSVFELGDAHWYGGGEEIPQKWPLEKFDGLEHAMVTMETGNRAVQDAVWFNSKGLLVYVTPGAPIFVKLNTKDCMGKLCLESRVEEPYRVRPEGYQTEIFVCKLGDAKQAFKYAVDHFLGKPTGYPDERMIKYPVWSTWAKYKADIDENVVKDFAKQIKDNGFDNSQFEIDDAWETCYGSKVVNTTRFPNMKQLTDYLKSEGFRVTIWTHPFIQDDCTETLNEAIHKGYLSRNSSGVQTHWWNGFASIVDFTNKDAAKWFVDRHQRVLEEHGIDGFKFDAGEVSWNPILSDYAGIPSTRTEDYPNFSTSEYIRAVAQFNGLTEVRSAYHTQDLPIFLRMVDKDSRWGDNNGLKSLVTTLLQLNMVGYSLVLPDMIGGNQYNGEVATQELFIRWLQANTFMPALQYALVPWDYKETAVNTVDVAKRFNDLHAKAGDIIIAAMKKNVADGSPVNPPIWWIDPTDESALKEDTEYLLGETILVAPILEEGATARDVYLPKGQWRDGNDGKQVHTGPKLIKNYQASLDTLPWFVIVGSDADKLLGPSSAVPALSIMYSVLIPSLMVSFLSVRW